MKIEFLLPRPQNATKRHGLVMYSCSVFGSSKFESRFVCQYTYIIRGCPCDLYFSKPIQYGVTWTKESVAKQTTNKRDDKSPP
jgi:hypothetical protein